MLFLIIFGEIVSLLITNNAAFLTDYCYQPLCQQYENGELVFEHNIGCNNSNTYSPSCPSAAAIQNITEDLQEFILELHNTNRNQTAGGNLDGFDQAERMTTMQWNDELAYLAELNCYRCYYGGDQCRNTVQFPHVGQNIDLYRSSAGYLPNNDTVHRIISKWFNEYNQANPNIINSFYHDGTSVGHFTQIVSGKSAFVGCALINWPGRKPDGKKEYFQYMVCNYSFTNMDGYPVYLNGTMASKCITGNNANYTALCSTEEFIQPVP